MIEMRVIQGEPDSTKKACLDCRHMKAAVSWWCTNESAADARKTKLPNASNCPFWEPAKKATKPNFLQKLLHINPDGNVIHIKCKG